MKATRTILAAAVTALTLGLSMAPVQARPGGMGMGPCGQGMMGDVPPCMGAGPGPGMMGGMGPGMGGGNMAANVEARLSAVKAQLKIAPEQETAWQAYADKVKEQAQRMQTLRESRPGASMNGPDRQAFRASMMRQRADEMDTIAQASRGLYATFTPEQKTVFDACPGPMAGRGMRGRGW